MLAVCIMGGLAFATLLTLIAVPIFYRVALGRGITTDLAENPPDIAAPLAQSG